MTTFLILAYVAPIVLIIVLGIYLEIQGNKRGLNIMKDAELSHVLILGAMTLIPVINYVVLRALVAVARAEVSVEWPFLSSLTSSPSLRLSWVGLSSSQSTIITV